MTAARHGHGLLRGAAGMLLLALFTATVVALAGWPDYRHLAADRAVVKVSLRHTGALVGECRTLTAEEIERLPPSMRTSLQATLDCPRRRSPLELELDVDGQRVIDVTVQAQGLHADGRAVFYRRFTVPAGPVRLDVRMKDDVRQTSFPYQASLETHLEPGRALIVDFDDASGSFVFL